MGLVTGATAIGTAADGTVAIETVAIETVAIQSRLKGRRPTSAQRAWSCVVARLNHVTG